MDNAKTTNPTVHLNEFQGYAPTTALLLSALGISDTTINKIVERINQGDYGPLPVYRRAVILCYDGEDYIKIIGNALSFYPLGVIIQPHQIVTLRLNESPITISYDEVVDNLELFAELKNYHNETRDKYVTLDFDELIESLNRTLILEDNNINDVHTFIFNLLYIVHFATFFKDDTISKILSNPIKDDSTKFGEILYYYYSQPIPFIRKEYNIKNISKEAFKYIFAILKVDTTMLDVELLSSLIYRMTNGENTGLFGHQTSFENVNKLLQPFIFEGIRKEIAVSTAENIDKIVEHIYSMQFFDPTNSPGCFLAAAYIGLSDILKEINDKFGIRRNKPLPISNFIGLVTNELTEKISTFALVFVYTMELMNYSDMEYPSLEDISKSIYIHIGDELNENWSKYVNNKNNLYIIGSPRFWGAHKNLPPIEKEKMQAIFDSKSLYSADYCSTWLVKSSSFIYNTPAKAAFVLTNSVAQGEQATFICNKINQNGCEYVYAYRSFKWKTSNDNAGVTVVIIGIASTGLQRNKLIIDDGKEIVCQTIGSTLLPDIDIRVNSRPKPISPYLPEMRKGNMPDGATALTFTTTQLDEFLALYPNASKYIRPLYGGDEFVKSSPRWVLWISDEELPEAIKIPGIAEKIEIVRSTRNAKGSTSSSKSRENPHKFRETNMTSKGKISIIIPCVTSERRTYFQMGILDSTAIVNNNVSVIFDGEIWLLALLESRMHTIWAKTFCGGHETRPRYSSERCYNTFPAPKLDKHQKEILRQLSMTLLEVRENYCDKSLATLYKEMPPELLRVHSWIDATVDSFYRSKPFESDEERLLWLKNLYNELVENE